MSRSPQTSAQGPSRAQVRLRCTGSSVTHVRPVFSDVPPLRPPPLIGAQLSHRTAQRAVVAKFPFAIRGRRGRARAGALLPRQGESWI